VCESKCYDGTPKSLSTIRKQVRESFKMTDAELLAYFNQRIEETVGNAMTINV